jgi:sirohydrochlorin cobaltochelatase
MKQGLLVVSFGTTYPKGRKAITALEDRLRKERPEDGFFRAFTSGMVIKKLKEEQGEEVYSVPQALDQMAKEGYTHVVCQSLHVIPGIEFEKMRRMLQEKKGLFQSLKLGQPLLSEQEDFNRCAKAMAQELPALHEKEGIVLMGHGTEHFANAAYSQMENTLRFLGWENTYVATVEGFPELSYVMARLEGKDIRTLHLLPFMIVAGDHAENDLAGPEEDSWQNQLKRQGYEVKVHLKGLGQFEKVGDIFADHLQQAKELD